MATAAHVLERPMSVRDQRRAPRELGYRGRQVLAYVRLVVECEGTAPSYGEIKRELGFHDEAGVMRVIECLERRALLSRVGAGKSRGRGRRVIRLVLG